MTRPTTGSGYMGAMEQQPILAQGSSSVSEARSTGAP